MLRRLYESPPTEQAARRPVGVTVVALLCFLAVLVVSTYLVDAVLVLLNPGSASDAAAARTVALLASGFIPLFVVAGVGLWRRRQWGRYLVVVFLSFAVISFFADSLLRYPLRTGLILGLSRSIVPIAIMLYLLHPVISAAFSTPKRR